MMSTSNVSRNVAATEGSCNLLNCGTVTNAGSLGSTTVAPAFSFRPRGSLARALYQRQIHDDYLNSLDKNEWYQCDLNQIPETLASKFVQLNPDGDTIKFLEQSEKKSDWIPTQVWHSLVKAILGFFMSQTSINGWLQRGSMFVVSESQFRKLLRVDESWSSDALLDLGAGDGVVTSHLAPLFKNVYTTEISNTMKTLLQQRGYRVLDIDTWHLDRKYDVISCLNLIDRCDTPLELIHQIRDTLAPNGRVLLAVVLPFSAYVESAYPHHKPKEELPISGEGFEDQVVSVVNNVFTPAGFEVESWSRVPYLCEGDLQQSYYWLDDAIFVLKLRDN